MSTTSAPAVVDSETDVPRRRPNPGYRVAPPVTDAFNPWVSVLDDGLGVGGYEWVLDDDGALVPIALGDENDVTIRPKRSLWRRR